MRAIRPAVLLNTVMAARQELLALATILVIANVAIQVAKWHFLLRLARPEVALQTSVRSLLSAIPLGFLTPGRVGEFGRALFVPDVDAATVVKLTAADKLSNIAIVVGLGSPALAYFVESARTPLPTGLAIAGLLVPALILGVLFTRPRLLPDKLRPRLSSPTRPRKVYARLLLFAAAFYGVFTLQYILLIQALTSAPLLGSLAAAASVFLTKTVLPVALGDLGIREGASVYFFTKIGASQAAAFDAAFLLFLINIGIPAVVGGGILLTTRIRGASHLHEPSTARHAS